MVYFVKSDENFLKQKNSKGKISKHLYIAVHCTISFQKSKT